MHVNPAYQLEQLYNRDSLPYIHEYGLEGVQSMYRGTLRYRGFSATMDALKAIGFFNDDSRQIPATWPELIQSVINAPPCRCCAAARTFGFFVLLSFVFSLQRRRVEGRSPRRHPQGAASRFPRLGHRVSAVARRVRPLLEHHAVGQRGQDVLRTA